MTFAEIQDILKTTAESLFASEYGGSGLFVYGIRTHQRQEYDAQMPQVHVDPFPDTLTTDKPTHNINITIGFFDQDEANSKTEEVTAIQLRMEELSRKYFGVLSDHDAFNELSINRVPIARYSQAVLTGYICTFTITTAADLC